MKVAFTKKLLTLILACGLVAGMCVLANAETTAAPAPVAETTTAAAPATGETVETPAAPVTPGFTIVFEGNVAKVLKDGKPFSTIAMRDGRVAFTSDASGNLIMKFVDDKGQSKLLSFGQEKTLKIDGAPATVTFDTTFPKDVAVNVASTAKIPVLSIKSSGSFQLEGAITVTTISGAAKINVAEKAVIGTLEATNGRAKVAADPTAKIATINSVSSTAVSNVKVPATNVNVSENVGRTEPAPTEDDDDDTVVPPTIGYCPALNK